MAKGGVLIMPSLYEGMPNVLMEAMRCGLPAIVSDIPANRAVLESGQEVLLFNPKASSDLSKIIEEVSSGCIDLEALAYRGYELTTGFLPELMVDRYHQAYQKILASK
jgi:glycosyltransferase involved in cell wall biosynthesis